MKNHLKLIPLEERIVLDAAAAAVIYVNVHTPASIANQTGADWAHAWSNLQSALAEAATHPGDQIWVAKGTYLPSSTGDPTATFNIPDQTSIYGGFKGTETKLLQAKPSINPTILSGDLLGNNTDNSYQVVTIGATPSETVTLDGLTITGGNNTLSGKGGGLSATNGSTVTLTDMTFSNDSTNNLGGAIYAFGIQSLNISNSEFLNNSTFNSNSAVNYRGGAIFAQNVGTFDVANSDFNGNSANAGGAIFLRSATNAVVTASTFERNTGLLNSGAIKFIFDTNVTCSYCVFDHNSTTIEGGGAIDSQSNPNASYTYDIFTNNSSLGSASGGGAFFSYLDTNVTISHDIFDHNTAVDPTANHANSSGALEVFGNNTATISYNIISNNTSDYGAIGTNQELNLIINNNVFFKNTATVAGGALNLNQFNPNFQPGILPDTSVTVMNNLFINNTAGQLGGAIASGSEINLVIGNNLFAHNSAISGGAIYDASSQALSISSNNIFAGNNATQGRSVWLDGLETAVNGANPLTNPSQVITNLVNDNLALFSNDIHIA